MAIFCWGNTAHGELGLGGIEEELILTPKQMSWEHEEKVDHASCGNFHTLFLTSEGKVFSCGKNDYGQLGHEMTTKRPHHVSTLDNYKIVQVSCGQDHSLALNEWGQVFSWGSNEFGQLGNGENSINNSVPKIMKHLLSKHIVQIACGSNHSLALSTCGNLFTWGSNTHGQLGLRNPSECPFTPNPLEMTSLKGIPIAFIACGANHSFVISKSGAVFGWGRNDCGQLGLNDQSNRMFPVQLKTLRTLGVCYISCGEEFSVFLTKEGGVFTCGSGTYGQLGHGNISNELLPRKVVELMGSTITQVKCGAKHTLAFVPSRGRVYAFGLGGSGQLGTRTMKNSLIPQVVLGPWVSPSGSGLFDTKSSDSSFVTVWQIFCGGDHSLAITTLFKDQVPAVDNRIYNPKTQILVLSNDTAYQCSLIDKNASVDLDLINSVELVFKSQACLNGSFLLSKDSHLCCTSNNHGIDFNLAICTFEHLGRIENENLKQIIFDSVTNYLLISLVPSPADIETLRIYLILPLYREFVNSKNYENLHTKFSHAVLNLTEVPKKIISKWWANTSNDFFEQLVTNYKEVVAYIISTTHTSNNNSNKQIVTYNSHLVASLNLLSFLNRINLYERKYKIHYEIFHWDELTDYVDIQQDYIHWLFGNNQAESFNICNFPFLFNASTKTTLLQTDQAIQMQSAMQNAAATGMLSFLNFGTPVSQFIVLNVSRENIVQDTLREIMMYNQADLKKPLKIKFYDEEAEDAGGVRKEFFMLLLKDLIDPKYGMFKEFEDSRAVWFSDVSFETDEMYFLIGIICGLAIYNFIIINLPFPVALYKKLLKEPTDLTDMRDLSPTIANSLQSILDYSDDDFEEVFNLHFEITRDVFGETKVELLKPEGDKISVSLKNKEEFVDLYVDYIFNKSVHTQFTAFQNGFMKVCWGRVLQIFKAHELMAVVVGNEDYDWIALETNTQYKDGYSSRDQTIRWFWEVFHDLPLTEKKKFLLFLTGSDRIPIQGMKAINIIIQPTNDEKCLPVAHTCFNLLDLPRYNTKERLKYKLLQAIQQTQGFSLV